LADCMPVRVDTSTTQARRYINKKSVNLQNPEWYRAVGVKINRHDLAQKV
jgi:hypothetical protein